MWLRGECGGKTIQDHAVWLRGECGGKTMYHKTMLCGYVVSVEVKLYHKTTLCGYMVSVEVKLCTTRPFCVATW